MEDVKGSLPGRTGSDPKPEMGMGEMEIEAAHALADMAVKRPDPQERGEAKVAKGGKKKAQGKTEGELGSSTSETPIPRRGKQHLTEAERKERKLRRILANRESARQTILRRQALRAELARKVAALLSENHNMKMEKEMAMQEFLSLKETNRQLKEQLAKLSMSKPDIKIETKLCSPAKFSGILRSGSPVATRGSGASSFVFSSNNSLLNPSFPERPPSSGIKCYEEKHFLPSVEETEVSCSLSLGLETETKPKKTAINMYHEKVAPFVAPSEEPLCVKVAAEARRRRREITRLKQTHRRA